MAQSGKRKHKRYTKRIETIFKAEEKIIRSYSSDISASGIFIRTNKGFPPGTLVEIELNFSDKSVAILKGRVRRTVKTQISAFKNGMGVELLEVDDTYRRFFKTEFGEELPAKVRLHPHDAPHSGETQRIKLKITPPHAAEESGTGPAETHPHTHSHQPADEHVIIPCASCGARNKVLQSRLTHGPKCGRCGNRLVE